jgi:hypothetical protein
MISEAPGAHRVEDPKSMIMRMLIMMIMGPKGSKIKCGYAVF